MHDLVKTFCENQHGVVLAIIIIASIAALVKGADLLVEEAVSLAKKWGVPTMIIGATIVSIGTTLPEAAVSVLAAINGSPGLALGNAVGSIICDTGLILGLTALIAPLPLAKNIVNRQGWLQVGAGFLLVAACLPYGSLPKVFTDGGRMPQFMGVFFLVLLALYIYTSIRWAGNDPDEKELLEHGVKVDDAKPWLMMIKLFVGIAVVLIASQILIPAVEVSATKMGIPDSIIAATLVAFGTSTPELVTAITAARKGHGGLAVGNIIGADILNVLFVAGAAAAVTKGGLEAPPNFFTLLFPAMLLILVVFRVGVAVSGPVMRKTFGVILLLIYVGVTVLSFSRGVSLH